MKHYTSMSAQLQQTINEYRTAIELCGDDKNGLAELGAALVQLRPTAVEWAENLRISIELDEMARKSGLKFHEESIAASRKDHALLMEFIALADQYAWYPDALAA